MIQIIIPLLLFFFILIRLRNIEKLEGVDKDELIDYINRNDLTENPLYISGKLFGKISGEVDKKITTLSIKNDKKSIMKIIKSL
jgi:hypothetical protein